MRISDASLSVLTNRFRFNIGATSSLVIVVEARTNLANPIWFPVGSNHLTGARPTSVVPQWMTYPGRFYRLRSL